MSHEGGMEVLPHGFEPGGCQFHEFIIQDLENPVHTVGHIRFGDLVGLFQTALFQLDQEFAVHGEDTDLTIRMGHFSYYSHFFLVWVVQAESDSAKKPVSFAYRLQK